MALTKVTGGIISQPINLGITQATTGFFSGIVTAQSVRVLGDLTVDGSTTTLDTVVTEVDRLEVGANNVTVGVAITQSGTGDILKLYDSSTPVFTVKDGGKVGIGTNDPDQKLHVYNGAGNVTSFIEAIAGDAVLDLSNSGNGNFSGINFIRERGNNQTGRNGGSIFMPSNTANNEAFLYIQTQSANAQAGQTGALTDNNGVRLKLHGDDGIFSIETGSSEKLRIEPDGNIKAKTGTQFKGFHLVKANGVTVGQLVGHESDNDGGGLNLWNGGTKKVQILANGNSYLNGGRVAIGDDTIPTQGQFFVGVQTSSNNYDTQPTVRFAAEATPDATNGDVSAIHIGQRAGGSADPAIIFHRRSGDLPWKSWSARIYQGGLDGLKFEFASAALPGSHTYTEEMVIKRDKGVGIGTHTPLNILDVNQSFGRQRFNKYGHYIAKNNGASTTNYWTFAPRNGGHLGIGRGVPDAEGTVASSNDKLIIRSDGNVIIGATSWNFEKALNVQGSSGHILSLYNGDTTTYAANTLSGIELKLRTGNTGNTNATCEIRAFKENGTNGDSARALSFYTGINGGSPTERLRIDSTGRFGFGTFASIDERGHMEVPSGTCRLKLQTGSTAVAGLVLQTSAIRFDVQAQNNFFHIYDNTVDEERLRITSDGKVGINETSPDSIFHIFNQTNLGSTAGNLQEILRLEGHVINDGILDFRNVRLSNGNNWETAAFRIQRRIDVTDMGYIDFGTGGGGSGRDIQFGSGNGTLYMHLDNTGNVGIGTDSPLSLLHVDGDVTIKDASPSILFSDDSGVPQNPDYKIQVNTGNFVIHDDTNSETRLLIDSSGNVGIGTDDPSALVHIEAAEPLLRLENTHSGSKRLDLRVEADDNHAYISAPQSSQHLKLYGRSAFTIATNSETSERFRITSEGNVIVAETMANNRPRIVLSAPDDGTGYRHLFGANLQVNSSGTFTTPTANISGGGWLYQAANSLNNHGHMIYMSAPDTNTTTSTPVERLRIDSDGNLIHTSTDKTLSLVDTRNVSQAGTKIAFFGADRYDTDEEFASIRGLLVSNSGGSGNKQNGSLQFVVGSASHTHAMTQGGYVGIGTGNPQALLHLQGTGGNTQGIYFKNGPHDIVRQYFNGSNDNSDFVITYEGTGGSELTLHADGTLGLNESNGDDVLIGTNASIGDAKLTVYEGGVGFTTAIALHNANGNGTGSKIISSRALVLSADYDNNSGSNTSYMAFETDAKERLRIASDGNVGIGTNNPVTKLHVESTTGTATYATISHQKTYGSGTGTAERSGLNLAIREANTAANNRIFGRIEVGTNLENDSSNGFMSFFTRQSAAISEKLRITSSGNVGIGTDIPDGKLHISSGNSGDCRVYIEADADNDAEGDNPFIIFKNDGGVENAAVWCGNADGGNDNSLNLSAATNVSGGIRFFTSSTAGGWETADERVRITSGGSALFGGLTSQTTDTSKLAVQGGDSNIGIIQVHAGGGETSGDLSGITFSHGVDGNTSRAKGAIAFECDGTGYGRGDLCFYVDGTSDNNAVSSADERVRIMNNGAIAIGTNNAVRGPVHIHQKSNDDVQIHLTNEETTATSSGRGFTIFGGAGTNGRDMGFVNRESNGAIEFYTNNNGTLTQRGAWVASDTIATFAINTGTTGTHSNFVVSNHDTTDYNGVANRNEFAMLSDIHFTGTDNPTGNRSHIGWRNDVENSITTGSNSSGNRIQVYGISSTLNSTKYAYVNYGAYLFAASTADNATTTQTTIGCYGYGQGYSGDGTSKVQNIYGGHFIGYRGGLTNGGHAFGVLGRAQQTTNGSNKTGDMTGSYGEVEIDEGTVANAYAFRAIVDMDNNTGSGHAASVLTTGYLYQGSYSIASGTTVTNKRGIWLSGCSESQIAGDLEITGSVTANGSKPFRIKHPLPALKDTKDLVHAAIEGPQVDLIYRGKVDLVNGTATINIDTKAGMTEGTFVALNRDVQCFTTNETGWTNVKGSVTGNQLTIIAQDNTCTDTISWMVIGERQDDAIKESTLTDADGKLILEPDQKPVEEPIKYDCDDNIHNADPDVNPAYEDK